MKLFLITLLYFAVVGLGIFFIFQIKNLSLKIKEHTKQINELQKELYKNLRVFQYRALDVSGNINKLLDKKSSIIAELILGMVLTILPFRKLKSLLLLKKMVKHLIP